MEYAGRPLSIETGEMARQADGAVTVRYGDTMALVTACLTRERASWASFLPLRIDFEEKMYAVGRIPGGFFKREGRPTEEATRTMGIIDKSVRPLLPSGLRNDVQIVATALSADAENSPDIVCIIGAWAALCVAGAPFAGPAAACEVGRADGELILNPSYEQIAEGGMRVSVIAASEGIVAIEMEGNDVPEQVVADALEFGAESVRPVVDLIVELQEKAGQPLRDSWQMWELDAEMLEAVKASAYDELKTIIGTPDKLAQRRGLEELTIRLKEEMQEQFPEQVDDVRDAIEELSKKIVQSMILDEGRRPDGRETTEVRDLESRVGFLPRTHGSGLFSRGDTQVLTVATLGAARDQKLVRTLAEEKYARFMHQYNFPPYSGGEVRPLRGPSRRDIRHGLLAERSLEHMLPDETEFPYTIRLVSEVLGSNSSSSMAAVCGSTLALMDAGVPIRKPVAGVGMGLLTDGDKNIILSDIQYLEDACGHMDFKVSGTRDGICALQLDMKTPGLSPDILRQALAQANDARAHILDNMAAALPEPRTELSQYAPRIFAMHVDTDKIGLVIGPGGKMIRKIEAECECKIDIEDDGTIFVAAHTAETGDAAREMIESLTKDVEVGEVYQAKVVSTKPFGAFVELTPGKDALVHISALAWEHVESTEDVVNVGDEVEVKIIEVDRDSGRIRASRKALLPRTGGSDDGPSRGGSSRGGGARGGSSRGDSSRGGGSRGGSSRGGPRRESGSQGGSDSESTPKAYFRDKPRKRSDG